MSTDKYRKKFDARSRFKIVNKANMLNESDPFINFSGNFLYSFSMSVELIILST